MMLTSVNTLILPRDHCSSFWCSRKDARTVLHPLCARHCSGLWLGLQAGDITMLINILNKNMVTIRVKYQPTGKQESLLEK